MSEQEAQKKLIRADFTYYPTMSTDDGEFLIASGYVYKKMRDANGKVRESFGRPMYQRLHLNQSLPFQLPLFESHEAVRDFLREEARTMLDDLSLGKLKADLSWRFRNCLYDDQGIFFEMLQGGVMSREMSQQKTYDSMPSPFDDRFPEVVPYGQRSKPALQDDGDDWLL